MTKKKEVVVPEARPVFSVAAGKAITTKKGVKAGGDIVTAEILSGGQAAIEKLTESGHITKG